MFRFTVLHRNVTIAIIIGKRPTRYNIFTLNLQTLSKSGATFVESMEKIFVQYE